VASNSRRLTGRLHLGLLTIVVGALGVTGIAPAQQVYYQNRLIDREKTKLAELAEKNSELERRLARSQDPAYVEKLAREQLGLVRPGETAYVVVPGPPIAAPPEPPPKPTSLLDRIARWLRNLI
jgi:cell division protein FtsB